MKVCSVCQRCYEDAVLSCPEENQDSLVFQRSGTREDVNGYRLDSLLGINESGGEIYKATSITLNQPCAIRILRPNTDDQFRERFLSEAQSVAALNHPNVIRLFDFGVLDEGDYYVVTESTTGQTLRECLLAVASMTELTALTIARQTAEGLQAAHKAGVIHRSINPENIFLTTDAENRMLVKIQNFDFGGIKQQYLDSLAHDAETRINELKYWSPEQCAGGQVNELTDVYSLGIVLYEMITGQPPFDSSDSAELIQKQIHETPVTPEIYNFDIRALLTHTLMLSLEKASSSRLKTATVFARQLRHIEQLLTQASISAMLPQQQLPISGKDTFTPVSTRGMGIGDVTKIDNPLLQKKEPAVRSEHISAPEIKPLSISSFPSKEFTQEKSERDIEFEFQKHPIVAEGDKIIDSQLDMKPIPVEWDQPDDIPSEQEVLEAKSEEPGETQSSHNHLCFEEDENFIVLSEPETLGLSDKETVSEEAYSIFRNSVGSQGFQSLTIASQAVKIGIGCAALLLLIGAGIFVSQQSQSETKTSDAKSIQTDNPSPKVDQALIALTKDKPLAETPIKSNLKNESRTAETFEDSYPELPKSITSEPVKVKKPIPISIAKSDNQRSAIKQPLAISNKVKPKELISKQPPSNKTVVKQDTSIAQKPLREKKHFKAENIDVLGRPRIVQNIVIHVRN
jgi:serine/threonine protein kinase